MIAHYSRLLLLLIITLTRAWVWLLDISVGATHALVQGRTIRTRVEALTSARSGQGKWRFPRDGNLSRFRNQAARHHATRTRVRIYLQLPPLVSRHYAEMGNGFSLGRKFFELPGGNDTVSQEILKQQDLQRERSRSTGTHTRWYFHHSFLAERFLKISCATVSLSQAVRCCLIFNFWTHMLTLTDEENSHTIPIFLLGYP